MKAKKLLAALMAVVLLLTMIPFGASAEVDPAATPISTEAELKAMSLDGNYYLANDITLTSDWEPIGYGSSSPTAFTGTFDGNGHTISGLVMEYRTGSYIGLFAQNQGTIKNLTLNDPRVKGYKGVGAIAGVSSGVIENCHVVDGRIVGAQDASSINALYNSAQYIGGLVGQNGSNGTITSSSSSAYVEGNRGIGGLAGANFGLIEKSFTRGAKINTDLISPNWANNAAIVFINTYKFVYSQVGGLAGANQGTIENCYAMGNTVQGWDYVGGLVGMMEQKGTVINSYCAEGGINGYPQGYYYGGYTLTPDALDFSIGSYSYTSQLQGVYVTYTSTLIPASGNAYTNASGLMKQQSTYKEFDFENIWTMEGSEVNNGYPVLGKSTPPVETYSVTYTDGVDGEEIFADQVYSDLKAGDTTPAFEGTPSREGYAFKGWTPDVEATVSGNAVYTAVWEELYSVTYTDGVDGEEIFADQVYSDLKAGDATPAFDGTPSREGYAFKGWTPDVEATVSGNAVYTAVWEELYSVTYTDGVDGEEIFADQVYTDLKAGDATPAFDGTPSREGYAFKGWTPDVEATVSGNAVYTAVWEELYSVTYTDGVDGEEIFADQVYTGLKAGDATPAFEGEEPFRAGYFFRGWTPDVEATVSGNAVYTAVWEKDPVLSVEALDYDEDIVLSEIVSNEYYRIRVVTEGYVEKIGLYNEYGLKLIVRDLTCTTNDDGTLTWIGYTTTETVGDARTLYIKPTVDGELKESRGSYTVKILPSTPVVRSAVIEDEVAEVNAPFTMTVVTDKTVSKLHIYNEYGLKLVGQTTYVEQGNDKVWTVTMTAGTAGNERSFKFVGVNNHGVLSPEVATSNTIQIVRVAQ